MSTLLEQVAQPLQHRITFIYALIDPRTEYIRYVGKANKPKVRLGLHLLPSQLKDKNHRTNWIRNVLDSGHKPLMIILEEVEYSEWTSAEKKWIAHYRNLPAYPPLTNSTDGGEGIEGYVYTEEDRKRRSIAHTGMKMPPGTGKKISDANRGIPKSQKAREHFSIGQRNRWLNYSDEEKRKVVGNLRTPWSDVKREKRSNDARNAKRPEDASSQYRNVTKLERGAAWTKQWRAGCIIGGKQICIGFFFTEEEAARARDRYFLKHIGEDIILNFPRADYPLDPNKIVVIDAKSPSRAQVVMKNSTGYKGIYKNGKNGWAAGISHMGVRYRLGTHGTREDAARAFDRKAIELYGDFARTNFARSSYD